MAFVTFEEKF